VRERNPSVPACGKNSAKISPFADCSTKKLLAAGIDTIPAHACFAECRNNHHDLVLLSLTVPEDMRSRFP